MEPTSWSLPAAFEVIAAAAPERDMLVWKQTRRTYAEVERRTRSLAAFLRRHGIGLRRERDELERWECGQATVALLLYNCPEYIETMLGCFRARAVPFNVNQHYRPEEVRSLLDMLDAEAVVYHRALAPLVAEAIARTTARCSSTSTTARSVAPLAGSTSFEDAVATPADAADLPVPSPDDLYLVCTGGTTGSPKAVLWRQGDIFVAAMGGSDDASRETLAARAAAGGGDLVRGAAADARRRAVDGVRRPPRRRDDRPARRLRAVRRAHASSRRSRASASTSCRSSATRSPGRSIEELRRDAVRPVVAA